MRLIRGQAGQRSCPWRCLTGVSAQLAHALELCRCQHGGCLTSEQRTALEAPRLLQAHAAGDETNIQMVTVGVAPFTARLPVVIVVSGRHSRGIRCRIVCEQVTNAAQAVIPFCLCSLSEI